VYFIAGPPEFAPFGLEGHILLIVRALYGLKSSGSLRWWERLSDVIQDPDHGGLEFFPSKAETDYGDAWMRRMDNHYDYICVYYVDNLVIVCSKDPQNIIDKLTGGHHKFNLNRTHSLSTLDVIISKTTTIFCATNQGDTLTKWFKTLTECSGTNLDHIHHRSKKGRDHPETDDSDLLELDGIKQYQSIIRSLQ
jgi:hypothetical protein